MKIETGLHGVDESMRARVRAVLAQTEAEHDIRIVFACESGSRGWGFASPDSDYDVRFLYVHKPEWYLRVDWLDSPVIYRQDEEVMAGLRAIGERFFSPERARWHYRSMAHKNFQHYLQNDEVRLKKYFYVLRPLLAVRWIEAGKGAPPMRFDRLLEGTVQAGPLREDIAELLSAKQRAGEAQFGPRRPVLHAFIEHELARAEARLAPPPHKRDDALLDALLFKTVMGKVA